MKTTTSQSKPKTFTFFDFIKAIINTKQSWDSFKPEQQKVFNSFMIHKSLSMNPKYIDIVNYVQGLSIKEDRKIYEVYCYMIPHSKNTFFPFIKSTVKKSYPELSKHVLKYFECSEKQAEEYIDLMDKDWVENILIQNGTDTKEIKKLLKEINNV